MLVGRPSDELDASWSSIMQYFYAEVPKEYIQSLDRERDSIRLPNGNYLANYAFIHQLHCLVCLAGAFPKFILTGVPETTSSIILPRLLLARHDERRKGTAT